MLGNLDTTAVSCIIKAIPYDCTIATAVAARWVFAYCPGEYLPRIIAVPEVALKHHLGNVFHFLITE